MVQRTQTKLRLLNDFTRASRSLKKSKHTVIQYLEGSGNPLQYSCLENPMDGGAWWAAVHGIEKSQTRLSDFTFTFHFHALEKEMATHSSVFAWRIPGTGEPGGLPSMGSHRVGHDWSDLAAVVALLKEISKQESDCNLLFTNKRLRHNFSYFSLVAAVLALFFNFIFKIYQKL